MLWPQYVLQQVTHPSAEARIIKVKASHVLGVLVFNDQKASIRLTLRDLYFYKRADFSRWVFIYISIYPHPNGRPVGMAAVRHERMGPQIHARGPIMSAVIKDRDSRL
jgi:hypothetical protein